MSVCIDAAARAYGAFYEALTPETVQDLRPLVAADVRFKDRLDAVCEAIGLWKLLHPIIALAMKKSDSLQLANLKAAMARAG